MKPAAYPIGPVEEGFRVAVEELLDTSRWLNAMGSAGIMRRAYVEAASFSRYRRAFGRVVGDFPLVRENLAMMKAEAEATLASTLELTTLVDRVDRNEADDEERAIHRFLVNANKYMTSVAASASVHRAIEALGGNGTIEDFSALPRLYRDAIVFESWEGSHNVLCEQVRRDCARLDLLDPVVDRVRVLLKAAAAGSASELGTCAGPSRPRRMPRCTSAGTSNSSVDWCSRRALMRETAHDGAPPGKSAVVSLFVLLHLAPRYRPGGDPTWSARIDDALAGDADAALSS